MGIDPVKVPEIRFVGKSLAEFWTYADSADRIAARLEACGLPPERFNPRSPNSFKGRGPESRAELAECQAAADRLFRGRLENLLQSCRNVDVRRAAEALLANIPAPTAGRPSSPPASTTPAPEPLPVTEPVPGPGASTAMETTPQ
jgi:hypothetical protein